MRQKIRHLRLEVVGAKGYMSTTSIAMPKELPSVEEALKLFAAISGLSGTVLGIFLGKIWKEKNRMKRKKTLFSGKKSVFSSSLKKTRKRMCAGHCLFLLVNCWFEKEFFSGLVRRRSGGAGRFFFS
jgi:MFS-type transporter involved in bile tolerance (Atg22 family)